MRRVVITGLGIISCLGNNQEEVHQSLLNSKSGISYAEEYKEHNLKSHIHGKPNIKLESHIDRKTINILFLDLILGLKVQSMELNTRPSTT